MEQLTEREQKIFNAGFAQGYDVGHRDGREGNINLKPSIPVEELPVKIMEAVCRYMNISVPDIKRKTRKRNVLYPRQILMFMLKRYTNLGFTEIARMFSKDHTTVIYSCRLIEDLYSSDGEVKYDVDYLDAAFENILTDKSFILEKKALRSDIKEMWADYYRRQRMQKVKEKLQAAAEAKPRTMPAIVRIEKEPKKDPINRPAAIYSNTGHLNLLNRYSEVS